MKKISFYLFITFCIVFNYNAFSQDKNYLAPNEFFTMHYYTFEGAASQDKLNELESALSLLDMVSEAKVKYKPEKNMGQILLKVKEKNITSEGDKSFSPTSIKQTIIKNGLMPMEYTTGKYEHK